MAYELPTDLIRQVKMVTRAEAGLSDFDPTRDLPPLPSLPEAVAAFDPSLPYLRCKNCKGRLLRGVQSVLCVYCGCANDVPPDPISFKDTFAYQWLLDSLHLDGSEMVGLTTEKSELNRGQSTPKGEIPLSDFLNVKVSWPTEVEKKEIGFNEKTEERSPLNLTGVDLDKFFSGSQTLDASDPPEEHLLTSNRAKAAEVKETATHNNLSFFENVQSSRSAVHTYGSKDGVDTAEAKEVTTPDDFNFIKNVQPSKPVAYTSKDKDDDGDASSGWEATFQSADPGNQLDSSKIFDPFVHSAVSSGNQHESFKLSDPFSGSAVDLSSQLDSVFGTGQDLRDGKEQDGTAASPSAGDWDDDLWNNLAAKVSQKTGQSDSTVGVKDAFAQHAQGFDWFEAEELQSNNVNAPSNNVARGDDDSFNEWNDFASSTGVNVSSSENSANVNAPTNNTTHGDFDSFNGWNDFASSTNVNVSSSENSAIQSQNQTIAALVKKSDLNLFSTDDKFEEMHFGSFSQADPFPSSSSKENVSAAVNDTGHEVSSSDRAIDTENGTGRGPGQPARDGDEDAKTAGTQQREEVERILSQMHDLSFMLENNLSLPPKSTNLHT